jgi:amidase
MALPLPEYDHLDAVGLAALVARGEVSATEVLEAALARADLRDPALNAIVARFDAEARRRAAGSLPPGPLSGVPFLLKDLMTPRRGWPIRAASRLLGDGWVPDFDSEVVRRLEAAGVVLFGHTSAPELGILSHTEPVLHGPCRNPWNLAHTPGGSSGGSAAAVSARIVPAAHGNDGGGSIRIPASACGLVGLKPTRGRVSVGPWMGEAWGGLTVEGVLTRTVRDAAAFLDVLAGPAPGDPYAAPPPARPWSEESGAPPGRLRIAFTEAPLFARTTHPECARAVRDAAALLAGLGHEVVEARPAFDRDALVRAYLYVVAAGVAHEVALFARLSGRAPGPATLEPETLGLWAAGRALTSADYLAAQEHARAVAREVAAFMGRHDVFLTATTARPAVKVGELAPTRLEALGVRLLAAAPVRALVDRTFSEIGDRSFEATGNTMLFNQTGQPAVSLPLHWTADGLPAGVQLAGRFGDEATLLRLAAQLEAARPWAGRTPPLPA